MISPKDDTQRRMLNAKFIPKNPKLASLTNIANRSPQNKIESKDYIANPVSSKKQLTANSPRQIQKESNKLPRQSISSNRIQINKKVSTITLSNGDRYQGEIVNGIFNGSGTYIFNQNQLLYEGNFENGKQHGRGVLMKLSTKDIIYEGEWKNGKKDGEEGRYNYNQKQYYLGDWLNDLKHGEGLYHFSDGFYHGEWFQNKREGKGTLKLNNGLQMKGTFANNQFVKGYIKYPNGDQYQGQFKNNLRCDQDGFYFYSNTKNNYKGSWFNDKLNGKGTIKIANGDQMSAVFINGQLNEKQLVAYIWKDGTKFHGWFRDGKPHKGTLIEPNGAQHEIY